MNKEIASLIVSGSDYLQEINYRTININSEMVVRSINVNQINGEFVVTYPMENKGQITVYPQSPNNLVYNENTYKNIGGYGNLQMPTDARFDFIRGKLWIADTGNSCVIRVDVNEYYFEKKIDNIILPHSIVPELNKGGVFIKGFEDINNGVIYYYNRNGILEDYCIFPCKFLGSSVDVVFSDGFVDNLPLAKTMSYDHVKGRLWWISDSIVYMMDICNKQVVTQDLSFNYSNFITIDVDLGSGNVFIVAIEEGLYSVVQISKDNNILLGSSYIDY